MFGSKAQRIQDLEQQIAVGTQQYSALQHEYGRLRTLFEQSGGGDAVRLHDQVRALEASRAQAESDLSTRLSQIEAMVAQRTEAASRMDQELRTKLEQRDRLTAELDILLGRVSDARVMDEYGLSDYTNPAEASIKIDEELAQVRARIKDLVRAKRAIDASTTFTFNNSAAKGRKFVGDMSTMMLRAYNAEAENCMLTVKAGNGEAARKRLDRARDQVRRLGTLISLDINDEYHRLRHRELTLTLEYQNAKTAEKEAEREERARLREERKVQQELEAQRKDLLKQRQHYLNVLATLKEQGREDEIKEIEARIAGIDGEIETVDYRTANIRAGYVYVISNIGAFGERMVKIGMTRRLDPMDRVRELGDASVPFGFDVHALFFSEDAVGVETDLHRRFADKRVNRINTRREFFYATPAEVRDVLTQIAGNLLEFTDEPEAEQYRLSLQVASHADAPETEPSHPALDRDNEGEG